MPFHFISLLSALLLLGSAAAVEITFYNGSSACSGLPVLTILGTLPVTCYTDYETMATSVRVSSLPLAAGARAYTDNCANVAATANGDSCLSGSSKLRAVNWSYNTRRSGPGLVRRAPEAEPRFSVTYEQPGGDFRAVEVASGHVKRALELVEARDYNALAEYPTFVKRATNI